jgi:hypothetical protein
MKNKLKYIDHLDLALLEVPTKALYKNKVIVAHEIQSRARAYAIDLQFIKQVSDPLKIKINQVHVERDEVMQRTGQIEQRVEEVFKTIPNSAKRGNIPT